MVFLAASAAWGQVPITGSAVCLSGVGAAGSCVPFCGDVLDGLAHAICVRRPEPKPLKCGKYQKLVPAHTEDCSTNLIGCSRDVPDQCVDDMHFVTEREWQRLMKRLDALEKKAGQK